MNVNRNKIVEYQNIEIEDRHTKRYILSPNNAKCCVQCI